MSTITHDQLLNDSLGEIEAEVMRLRAENERLKAERSRSAAAYSGPALSVSKNGGVSIHRINSLPLTLYPKQLIKILDMSEEIRTFIKDHTDELKWEKPKGHVSIAQRAKEIAKETGKEVSFAPVLLERVEPQVDRLQSIIAKIKAKIKKAPTDQNQPTLPGMGAQPVNQKSTK